MKKGRRSLVHPVAVACFCALALNACASDEKKISLEQVWAQDKQQINASIQQLHGEQSKGELRQQQQASKLAELESRIEALEKQSQTQQAEVKALSSRLLHARRQQPTVAKKPKFRPVPKKSVKLQPKQRTTPVKPLSAAIAPTPVAPKVDKAAVVEAEKNAYTSAYLALKSGRYDEAANAFNKQLDLYPDGEYADQAWYWLGETRFAQNDTDRAFNAFKYVADHYANSVKHAAALLKLGQIAESRRHFQKAALFYKRLIQEHADSSLAEQAREALSRVQAGSDKQPGN